MHDSLLGALTVANTMVMAFFLKFWLQTKDIFYLFFSTVFLLLALERALSIIVLNCLDNSVIIYVIRLLAFSCIAAAIIYKNMHRN